MKNPIIKYLSLIVTVMWLLPAGTTLAQSSRDTVTIKISSVCDMCAETVQKALAYEKGVLESRVDGKKQTAMVIYNVKKTTPEKIRKAITMAGYDADDMPADKRAFDKLDECCKIDRNHIH